MEKFRVHFAIAGNSLGLSWFFVAKLIPAPKGRHSRAQGETLGLDRICPRALKGRHKCGFVLRHKPCAALSELKICALSPSVPLRSTLGFAVGPFQGLARSQPGFCTRF